MRAALYRETGPARDVFEIVELPTPDPRPGEVRVRLHTSGVNPADVKRRGGWARIALDLPYLVPHDDGAGIIDAVGEGVSESRIGARVWVYDARLGGQHGTAAEWVCVPTERAEPLPHGVDFAAGASIGVPGRTAHRCLFSDGPIDGANVLVAGAAGSVGHSAVQQARAAGAAVVIGTVGRPEHHTVAREAGCQAVLDYRDAGLAGTILDLTNGHGIDRLVEVDFAANAELDCRVAAVNSTIATYATDTDHKPEIPLWRMLNNSVNLRSVLLYNLPYDQHRLAADDLVAWSADGRIRPRIGSRFTLDEIASSHESVEKRTSDGNVVVDLIPADGAT
jgi:NADPH2:quinone reductase